jgi:hypothetical protein
MSCMQKADGVKQIILKCSETRQCRKQFLSRKWLIVNEEVAHKRITNCNNYVLLRNVRKCDVNGIRILVI